MVSQLNALDPNGAFSLRLQARDNSPESNKAVAKQFEALILQQMLKGMRQAMTTGDGPLDSESTRFYQGLYDQQLATVLTQKGGIGLAKYIERQLNGQFGAKSLPDSLTGLSAETMRGGVSSAGAALTGVPSNFIEQLWNQAQQAAGSLGVPPQFLVAHAALETGWGKAVIQCADGRSSNNLFNIKAGKNWTGKVVEAKTTEYENGQSVVRVERFRAYNSYAESFQDYADLINQSSRYAAVRGQTDARNFAVALQQGGYATDPGYADKLVRIINGSRLRQGLLASVR